MRPWSHLPVTGLVLLIAVISGLAGVAAAQPYFINCGGDTVTVAGTLWEADRDYVLGGYGGIGGVAWENKLIFDVGGAPGIDERTLFRHGRRGYDSYRFNIPNGDYIVALGFNETEYHGPGFRAFDVDIEGVAVLDSLDIASEYGPWYSVIYRFPVTLTDQILDIEMTPLIGDTDLCSISVVEHPADAEGPATPKSLVAHGSYERNLLDWKNADEEDLAGYNVYRVPMGGGLELLTPTPEPVSRFLDDDVTVGINVDYEVRSVDVFGNESNAAFGAGVAVESESSDLATTWLTISDQDIYTLNSNVYGSEYVPAIVRVDGVLQLAEARYRGSLARLAPKKSFRIRLPGLLNGRDRVNLNSEFVDAWMVRNKLGFDLFEGYAPIPNVEWIHLRVNGEYAGIYSEVENYDEHFLERVGLDSEHALYKATGSAGNLTLLATPELYETTYEKKTGPVGHTDIIELVEFINLASTIAFHDSVAQRVDIDSFLDYYTVIIGSSRNGFTANNYYLYHDLDTDLWRFLPWDNSSIFGEATFPLDFGTLESPTFEGSNRLIERLLNLDVIRYAHAQHLLEFMDAKLNLDFVSPIANAYHDTLHYDAERDFWKQRRESIFLFDQMVPFFEDFVTERRTFIETDVYNHMPSLAGEGALYINELVVDNQSVLTDEMGDFDPMIELHNGSIAPLNLGGMYLSDSGANSTRWTLPDITLPAGAFLVVVADEEESEGALHTNFTLSPLGGAVYLYDIVENGNALIDSLTYPPQAPDAAFGRFPDGGAGTQLAAPSLGSSNVPALNQAPLISGLSWTPEFPADSEPTVVSCQVVDDHTLTSVELLVDTGSGFLPVVMLDDGASGDGESGDGVFGAQISGQPAGTLVNFYVQATDDSSAVSIAPPTAPADTFVYPVGYSPPALVLNELLSSNIATNQDEGGEFADWFEIHNAGPTPIDLDGMYASDNFDTPRKWQFPAVTIDPGAFLIVWCDHELTEGPLHAAFRLDADGEELGLFDTAANGWARIDTVFWGPQTSDVSWGRDPDAGPVWRAYAPPTPGISNVPTTHDPPVITSVVWTPEVPADSEVAQVTCMVIDDSGLASVDIHIDSGSGFSAAEMFDDGAHGDGASGDSIYGATIAGQLDGTLVGFFVEATDDSASITRSPVTAPSTFYAYRVGYVPPPLFLNELQADNASTIMDGAMEFDDWFELHNAGETELDLSGMYASDDLQRRTQWALPDTTIPAGGFMVFWADRDTLQGSTHTNFALEKNGEQLALFDTGVNAWSRIDSIAYPPQVEDESWGREVDAAPIWTSFAIPTPGLSNLFVIGVTPLDAPTVPLWLGRAYPNPMGRSTTISFSVGDAHEIALSIYDVSGRMVRRLVDGPLSRGDYSFDWDGHDERGMQASSGIYFIRLEADGDSGRLQRSNRLVLIR